LALTERLQIIVTADGKGATNEFQKIGATAERELGRTDDKIKRLSSGLVSSGTQIALAGGIATAGVFALAKAAGDYEEAASAAGVIFGDASEAVEQFGKDAIESAGLSRRAAVEAANTFGTFGKAAGLTGDELASFSTDLTQLAGDLASFKNTSTEDAITAIGAALRGESEPIRKYGVLLDDATLKQEALSLGIYDGTGALDQQSKVLAAQSAIFKQTSDAQGDYQRTSESLSNQTRAFTAQVDNLKVGLGEGAVPVFSELVGVANDALLKFQELNPETQNIVGRLGAIGALGATAVGGLAVIGGGVLRLIDTFGSLRNRLTDTQGELTRTGQVATTAGKVIGGAVAVGGVLLLADALFQLTQNAGNTQQAIDKFKLTVPKGDAEKTLSVLNSLGEGYKDLGDALIEPLVGSAVIKTSDEFGVSLANVDRAINDLYKKGDIEGARASLQALADVKLRPDNAENLDAINEVIDRYTPKLNDAEAATKGVSKESTIFGQVLAVVEQAQSDATDATTEFAGALDRTNKLVKLSGDMFDLASGRADSFQESLSNSTGIDDLLSSTLKLTEATRGIGQWVGDLSASVDISDIADGLATAAEDTSAVLQKWLEIGTEAQQVIADTLEFQGADAAVARADGIRLSLVGVMEQAGYTDEQIQELLTSMGLTEGQVDIAIEVSGTDEAIAKLTLLRDFYMNEDGSSGIPSEVETQVSVAIAEGRFVDAANLISLWVQDQEDGSITNPLLIAMGLGDTQPASEDVDAWKRGEESKPPANIPVDANTEPARIGAGWLFRDIEALKPKVTVGFKFDGTSWNLGLDKIFSNNSQGSGSRSGTFDNTFDNKPRRAAGGPVDEGQPFWANEPSLGGELFRPATDGFVMNAGDTDRLISGVEALVSGQGGSGVNVTQTIVTADPVVAGSESARKMRDAAFLAGV
jgi:hypothetical protein